MTKNHLLRVSVYSAAGGALISPTVVWFAQLISGGSHPVELYGGAVLSTIFFSISSIVALGFQEHASLKKILVGTYVLKAIVLGIAGLVLSTVSMDRPSFAIGMCVSAVLYLAIQTGFLIRSGESNSSQHQQVDL